MTIADQILQVRQNINQYCRESGRNPDQVRLLAVSKTHPASAIQAAYASGITEFGESYLQEALDKIRACGTLPICWHFIGPIQSNKTRAIAENFQWVQSVERDKILRRLSEQRPPHLAPLNICIQANLFEEPTKQGASGEQLNELLALSMALPRIRLRGLMVIPPPQADLSKQRAQFQQVAEIFYRFKKQYSSMDTLSMGMSGDLPAAIAEGSNMVRVGTAIFGPRQAKSE